MRHYLKAAFFFLFSTCFTSFVWADPWFTGPLLAPAGHTVPKGHTNFEIYGLNVNTDGHYNQLNHIIKDPLFQTFIINPILTHGFTDWLDVQLVLPYAFNSTLGRNTNRLSDLSTAFGIQLMEQKKEPWKPTLRLLIQETYPTGRFERLNPASFGTDATGLGAYQTQIGLNFQHLANVFDTHYLRTRLILSRIYSSDVHVHGFSSYGGTATTDGKIATGASDAIDLAFEYTLTQNWVAVMEGYYSRGQETRFDGILSVIDIGNPAELIGRDKFSVTGLAPAIEYNFNANIGLIGGVWFPVQGTNTSHFITYTLALNAYW
jgi:hypothetical protein